jgi:2'-5' RNA ligase
MTRMFAGVLPPEEAIDHLDEFLSVRREAADFRWSLSSQFHVTLAFLEDVPDRCFDDLVERLELAGSRRTSFTTRIAGGGAFPNPRRARILYAGLDLTPDSAEELSRLATGARAAATTAGVVVDGQRFRPHVTVARLSRPTEVSNWVRLLDTYEGPAWPADRITLVASYLGEGPGNRPRYETVAELPLAG